MNNTRHYTSIGLKIKTHSKLAKISKINKRPITQQIELWVDEECTRLGINTQAERVNR